MRRFIAVFLLVGGLLAAGGAHATPVTWTVNKTFTSGDTVVGSFIYDADTNAYSSINVVYTQSGNANTLVTCSATCSNGRFVFATALANGNPAIDFILSGGQTLTNSGGTINSATGAYGGTCNGAGCLNVITANGNSNQSFVLSGTIPAAQAVPTLSEWSQMLLGLMVLSMIGWHFHRERLN